MHYMELVSFDLNSVLPEDLLLSVFDSEYLQKQKKYSHLLCLLRELGDFWRDDGPLNVHKTLKLDFSFSPNFSEFLLNYFRWEAPLTLYRINTEILFSRLQTFLPYILAGDLQTISPAADIWWDKDWSQPIIQLLSQEHLHGLWPISNLAEMFTSHYLPVLESTRSRFLENLPCWNETRSSKPLCEFPLDYSYWHAGHIVFSSRSTEVLSFGEICCQKNPVCTSHGY